MIEKGGQNLGRAREGRFDDDTKLANPRYMCDIRWIVSSSKRPTLALPKFGPPFSIIAITPYPFEQEKKTMRVFTRKSNFENFDLLVTFDRRIRFGPNVGDWKVNS